MLVRGYSWIRKFFGLLANIRLKGQCHASSVRCKMLENVLWMAFPAKKNDRYLSSTF